MIKKFVFPFCLQLAVWLQFCYLFTIGCLFTSFVLVYTAHAIKGFLLGENVLYNEISQLSEQDEFKVQVVVLFTICCLVLIQLFVYNKLFVYN